jgi:hypothetical protein
MWKYVIKPKILFASTNIKSVTHIELCTDVQILGADLTALQSNWVVMSETNIN